MLSKRNALAEHEIFQMSQKAQRALTTSAGFKSAESIGAYHSFGSETRTDAIIREATMLGKKVSLPRVEGPRISFYGFSSEKNLVKSKLGIMEPLPHGKTKQLDLVLVPGIAFDRCGHRLGYGKGYYDRYLSESHTFSIGLAYSFQVIDRIPRLRHDKRLDALATENGLVTFGAR